MIVFYPPEGEQRQVFIPLFFYLQPTDYYQVGFVDNSVYLAPSGVCLGNFMFGSGWNMSAFNVCVCVSACVCFHAVVVKEFK